jgi:hypothetical protein
MTFHFTILKLKAMKKIFLATAAAVIAGFFIPANAGISPDKMDKEARKQIRREKREERREQWLHSVNRATQLQFYSDFPGAKNVSWREAHFAEATFLDGPVLKTAYYDPDNALVGTTSDVAFSALPEKAKQYINKKYRGYTAGEVVLFDDNEANTTNMYLYNSSFEDEDNYFLILTKKSKEIILKVSIEGDVSFFTNYK